ncbi:S-layer homology domain-containing protein [Alteribacillus sp. HJP-4]|uniref:S-layer homology domain-containing protein n=1 Tax=Alteribacillus sp. HJP-4 TaxID=2775394 RepID=UPI0035CCCB73
MQKKMMFWFFSLLLLFSIPFQADAADSFADVNNSWASDEIQYISDREIVNGYKDGTFKPDNIATRQQAAKMLTRALELDVDNRPDPGFKDVNKGNEFYPYIATLADEGIMKGDKDTFRPREKLNRSQMAVIIDRAYSLEEEAETSFSDVPDSFWAASSIKKLAAAGISTGHNDGTFGKDEKITRAHFSVFLARALNPDFRDYEVNTPPDSDVGSEEKAWGFRGIQLGDSLDELTSMHGESEAVEQSHYGFDWHIYHDSFDNYVQYGIENNEVVAVYTNQNTWEDGEGLRIDNTKADVKAAYGESKDTIEKGDSYYKIETDESGTYDNGDFYSTYFYDKHREDTITSVMIIDSEVEENFRQYYAEPSDSLKSSYERQVFYLANSQRVRFGKDIVEWDEQIAQTARSHSEDMASNSYFEHTNLQGESPFDRMSADEVNFYRAAENIAYGQTSPIFAHQSWMNSNSGHRKTLLGDYERLGVGVAINEEKKQPYFTQNFYTPR